MVLRSSCKRKHVHHLPQNSQKILDEVWQRQIDLRNAAVPWRTMTKDVWFHVFDYIDVLPFCTVLSQVCKAWLFWLYPNGPDYAAVRRWAPKNQSGAYDGVQQPLLQITDDATPNTVYLPEATFGPVSQLGKAWHARTHLNLDGIPCGMRCSPVMEKLTGITRMYQSLRCTRRMSERLGIAQDCSTYWTRALWTPGTTFTRIHTLRISDFEFLKGYGSDCDTHSFWNWISRPAMVATLRCLELRASLLHHHRQPLCPGAERVLRSVDAHVNRTELPVFPHITRLSLFLPCRISTAIFKAIPYVFPSLQVFDFHQQMFWDHNDNSGDVPRSMSQLFTHLFEHATLFCKTRLELTLPYFPLQTFLNTNPSLIMDARLPEIFLHICSFDWSDALQKSSLDSENVLGRWVSELMTRCPNTRFYCNDMIPEQYLALLPRRLDFLPWNQVSKMECYCHFIYAPRRWPSPVEQLCTETITVT